jgi:hypothetical protein
MFDTRDVGGEMNRILIVCIIGVLFGSPAWAGATVEPVKSPVSMNRGQGYQMVTKAAPAANGDQVMAGPGGHARIVYADGCVTDVYPGGVASVGKCYKPMTAGPPCDPNTDPKCLVAPVAAGIPWWVWPVAAGIGVAAACVGFCNEEEHHHPHSP